MWRGGMTIEIKTPEQIAAMREAGLVVARTLRVLADAVRPGITTAALDALAEAEIRGGDAGPDRGRQDPQRARDHQAGLAHHRELLGGLDLDSHAGAPHT